MGHMGWGGYAITVLGVFGLIGGCGHDGRLQYLEPPAVQSNVATFDIQCRPLAPVWLDEIDGAKLKRPDVAAPYAVRVLPGKRYLTFTRGLVKGRQITCYFVTVPNHTYRVEGLDAQVRISDVETGSSSIVP